MSEKTNRPVTDDHRSIARIILTRFWLSQVARVAANCVLESQPMVMVPPTREQFDAAAQTLADLATPPEGEISVAQ